MRYMVFGTVEVSVKYIVEAESEKEALMKAGEAAPGIEEFMDFELTDNETEWDFAEELI